MFHIRWPAEEPSLLKFDHCLSITVIWSPYQKHDTERVEQVQRRFAKRLKVLRNYTQKTTYILTLPLLELGGLRSDLVWCYKIVFGLTALTFHDFSSRILLQKRAFIISNFIKPNTHAGLERFSFQSVLLMGRINCPKQPISALYVLRSVSLSSD